MSNSEGPDTDVPASIDPKIDLYDLYAELLRATNLLPPERSVEQTRLIDHVISELRALIERISQLEDSEEKTAALEFVGNAIEETDGDSFVKLGNFWGLTGNSVDLASLKVSRSTPEKPDEIDTNIVFCLSLGSRSHFYRART